MNLSLNGTLLPVLVFGPMLLALVCYIAGRFSKRLRDVLVGATGILTFAGCVFIWLKASGTALTFTLEGFCGLGLQLRADGFRGLYAAVASFMWMVSGLFSPEYFAHYHNRNRYYFFNLMTLGATLGVFLSDDLYTTFIFFEVMSLTSYTWVAHEETPGAMRAAGTYLAVAVIGGLTTLMGLFLLWHDLGTLSFEGLRQAVEAGIPAAMQTRFKVSVWLVLFGFAAKAGLFPLHIWLPKAHPVAPAPASALLSGILTKSGVFGLIVICANLRMGSAAFGNALLVLACITMFGGALLALLSVDLKRTLACSSMSQIGFIAVGLSCMVLLGEEGGLAAAGALMHMVNHSLIKLCLFLCAGVVYMNLHKLNLNDIRGFGRKKPVLHIAFLLGALAIACIPPLGSGYNSKSLIHEGLLECIEVIRHQGGPWQWYKAAEVLFLVSGGLTIAYMTKLYICLFWEKNASAERQAEFDAKRQYIRPFTAVVLLLSAVVLPLLGAFPAQLFSPMAKGAMPFFHQTIMVHIEYFSAENLIGAAKSILIGALVYLLVVRPLLMRREDGCRVYVDRWPARLDLEDRVYRPLLLRVLPGAACLVTRAVAELPEWIVLVLRRSVFRKSRAAAAVSVGNRLTWTIGRWMNAIHSAVNRTFRREQPLHTDMELRLGNAWEQLTERASRMNASVSYGLVLMAIGLLLTCLYLLLV